MTEDKDKNPKPKSKECGDYSEIPVVKEIIVASFEEAITPRYNNDWFFGPGSFTLLKDEDRARKIRDECDVHNLQLGQVSLDVKRALAKTYEDTLNAQISCLKGYNRGAPPKPPMDFKFREKPTLDFWIRDTLGFYMAYGNKLEELFYDEERERRRDVFSQPEGMDDVKYRILSEEGTWGNSRRAIRKLLGLAESVRTEESGMIETCFGSSELIPGLQYLMDHFGIPEWMLEQDRGLVANAYDDLIKSVKTLNEEEERR
ncbi:MAG: hypothetical protein ABH864_06930 [archaeon]